MQPDYASVGEHSDRVRGEVSIDGLTLGTAEGRSVVGNEGLQLVLAEAQHGLLARQRLEVAVGMDVGADGYIVKSSFDEQSLLAAVDRLVGTSV